MTHTIEGDKVTTECVYNYIILSTVYDN